MLFYRESFPVFLTVRGLCCNLATLVVSCPMKIGRMSIKLSTKGWISRTRGPFLPLPSSQEELFCFLAFGRICSFSLHLPGHQPTDCLHILCSRGGEPRSTWRTDVVYVLYCIYLFVYAGYVYGSIKLMWTCGQLTTHNERRPDHNTGNSAPYSFR